MGVAGEVGVDGELVNGEVLAESVAASTSDEDGTSVVLARGVEGGDGNEEDDDELSSSGGVSGGGVSGVRGGGTGLAEGGEGGGVVIMRGEDSRAWPGTVTSPCPEEESDSVTSAIEGGGEGAATSSSVRETEIEGIAGSLGWEEVP